jgi:hypothetical protein
VFPAPFAAGFTPIRLVSHHHFLVAGDHFFKFPASWIMEAAKATFRPREGFVPNPKLRLREQVRGGCGSSSFSDARRKHIGVG